MASHSGRQRSRWSAPLRRSARASDASADPEPDSPPGESAPVTPQRPWSATTVGDDDDGQSPATASTGPTVAELAGLASMIATVQEELIRMRGAVEALQTSVDEALELLRAPPGDRVGAVLPTNVRATDAPAAAAPVRDAPADVAPDVAESDGGTVTEDDPPPPPPPSLDDVAPPVTVVREPAPIPEPPAPERRRRVPMLILIAVVVGLLVAGVAIAIAMVGWSELRSELSDGLTEVFSTFRGYGAVIDEVADHFVVALRHHIRAG